jgi:acetylglutamate synthase
MSFGTSFFHSFFYTPRILAEMMHILSCPAILMSANITIFRLNICKHLSTVSCSVVFGALPHSLQVLSSLDVVKPSEMPLHDIHGVHVPQDEILIVDEEGSTSESALSQDGDPNATPRVRRDKKQKNAQGTPCVLFDENDVSNLQEESEYSAPKFMSLVCVMQMVKLMDAVGILFPHTLPEGIQPITSKKDFLEQFASAKMSAHIDCPNCKAFVSYRWYANDVKKLKTHLASPDPEKVYYVFL